MKVFESFRASISSLKYAPRELYINFLLKFCESYNYFSISQILVIFLNTSFHFSDLQSATMYGLWGTAITFWGLVTSTLNDRLGVRNSLLLGFFLSACATFMTVFTTSKLMIQLILYFFLPLGNCMGMPMLTVGIRRYTTVENRGFAFGLYYSVMNIGAFISGFAVDLCNINIRQVTLFGYILDGNRLVILTTTISSMISFTITLLYLREINISSSTTTTTTTTTTANTNTAISNSILIHTTDKNTHNNTNAVYNNINNNEYHEIMMNPILVHKKEDIERKEDEDEVEEDIYEIRSEKRSIKNGDYEGLQTDDDDDDNVTDNENNNIENNNNNNNNNNNKKKKKKRRSNGYIETRGHEENDNNINNNNNISYDNHNMDNTNNEIHYHTKNESHYTIILELLKSKTFWRYVFFTLFLINLKSVFRHLDATFPTYLVRCFGQNVPKGIIYSINPFMIMFLTPIVSAVTTQYAHYDMIKYGGYVTALSPLFLVFSETIWASICMMIVLSLGEAVWSPRTYDYTMSIAPEGKEASFAALATAPLFVATVPVGLMSGILINVYLPEHGPRNTKMLWLIITLTTLLSPILITIMEPCVREPLPRNNASSTTTTSSSSTGRNIIQDVQRTTSTNNVTCTDDDGDYHNLPYTELSDTNIHSRDTVHLNHIIIIHKTFDSIPSTQIPIQVGDKCHDL